MIQIWSQIYIYIYCISKYVVSFSSKAWFLMVLFKGQGGRDSFQLRLEEWLPLHQSISIDESPWNFPMMNHHLKMVKATSVWVNYHISLTWNFWLFGDSRLRSLWGRYNLPSYITHYQISNRVHHNQVLIGAGHQCQPQVAKKKTYGASLVPFVSGGTSREIPVPLEVQKYK